MANKNTSPSPRNTGGKQGFFARRKPGDTERWVWGFTLLFLSLFVLLSVVSYYFTWSSDQTIIREGMRWSAAGDVANSAGKVGAFTGAALVGKLFGLFALGIPVVAMILSLRIMRLRPLFLDKSVRITFIIMILGSLSLGFAFGTKWGIFGTGLGGEAGIAAAEWFVSLMGGVGFALLLIMGWVLVAVYINRRTIKVVNRVGSAVNKSATGLLARKSKTEDDTQESDYLEAANVYSRPEPEIVVVRPEPQVEIEILRDEREEGPAGEWAEEPFHSPDDGEDEAMEELSDEEVRAFEDAAQEAEEEDDDFVVVTREGERVRASSLREPLHEDGKHVTSRWAPEVLSWQGKTASK